MKSLPNYFQEHVARLLDELATCTTGFTASEALCVSDMMFWRMGFVACSKDDGDFLLCQSWDFTGCERLSQLKEKRTFVFNKFDFNRERTRTDPKTQIDCITFVYVRTKKCEGGKCSTWNMTDLYTYLQKECSLFQVET